MEKSKIIKSLYFPYFWGPLVGLMLILLFFFGFSLKSYTHKKQKEILLNKSTILQQDYSKDLSGNNLAKLKEKMVSDSLKLDLNLTLLDPQKDPVFSASLPHMDKEKDFIDLVLPLKVAQKNLGHLKVSKPLSRYYQELKYIFLLMGIMTSTLLASFFILNYTLTKKIIRPLKSMRNYALKIAEGDFSSKILIKKRQYKEIKQLGHTLNKMKDQLEGRIQTIIKNKNEKEAVFSSMIEGVLTVDLDGRIIDLNNATRKLFNLKSDFKYKGHPLEPIIQNEPIQKITAQLLKKDEPIDTEIDLEGQTIIRLQGAPLKSMDEKIGALLVLNDVTRLRKLERHRKDFVGNVSHELRTPLTAILGFVETITEGKVDDIETQNRFISIIQKQANRLYAIIEDLLDLSRIEKEAEGEGHRIEMNDQAVKNMIELALLSCEPKAKKKSISLHVDCPDSLEGKFNSLLMVRALSNLIDNAIKYGPEHSQVKVSAFKEEEKVIFSVKDLGPGIDEKHHERLFERFYSVDKARSKELGGSGIGLAIVKHIALAHGGQVKVESSPGRGSTFSLHLGQS
ncbi:MAG: ATP-binding protein [Bdellovibrionota bacterium]|nr:ATP-binding protein [Bdellovibrionota bacterium]